MTKKNLPRVEIYSLCGCDKANTRRKTCQVAKLVHFRIHPQVKVTEVLVLVFLHVCSVMTVMPV